MADQTTSNRYAAIEKMDNGIAIHSQELSKRCRVHACQIKDIGHALSKKKFALVFSDIYGVDINEESPLVYPELVCDVHARFFRRYREAVAKDRSLGTTKNHVLHQFLPHSKPCEICDTLPSKCEVSRGRPRKRAKVQDDVEEVQILAPKVPVNQQIHQADTDGDANNVADCLKKFQNLKKEEMEQFLSHLCNNASVKDREFIAHKLGMLQSEPLAREAELLEGKYSNLEFLRNLNVGNYLSNMDTVTLRYLDGLCGLGDCPDEKSQYMTAHVMEILYRMRRKNLVTPLCFMHNLDVYALTGSRQCLDHNSQREPSGTYNTVVNWLNGQASGPPVCPDGDILCIFDNDQVVGKTYGIRPDSKVMVSVITNCAWAVIDQQGSLQCRPDLMPKSWINSPQFVSKVAEIRSVRADNPLDVTHYNQLYQFISSAIELVASEQVLEDGVCSDFIDNEIRQAKKSCKANSSNTGTSASSSSSSSGTNKFRDLSQKKSNHATSSHYERYGHVESEHPDTIPEVSVADPVFLNPNSLENISLILRKIGQESGITRYGGVKRQWLLVVCDGLPYTLAMKVIKETRACNFCHQSFLGEDKLQEHFIKNHPDERVLFYYEFDWVILKIGGGHYEMNMMKSFFEFNWIPFLSEFSKLYGFKSDKAQNYAKSCKDTHKAWYMLLSFHIGSMNELVLEYVRKCLQDGENPTAEGFLRGNKVGQTPNYLYIQEQVFTYSQAVINMRMGTRRSNLSLIYSAKHAFRGLFHGRSHDKYQMIEMYEALHNELYPSDLRAFLGKCQSLSRSGDPSRGQDFDFILEEINKATKSWIPKGVPSQKSWLTVCRNIDNLEALRKVHKALLGKSDDIADIRNPDLSPAVSAWRKCLRSSGYLQKDSLCSISGVALDNDLNNFTEIALSKRYHLINHIFLDIECPPVVYYPVFVTPAEREKYMNIRNQTKFEIGTEIELQIAKLDDDVKTLYESKYKHVKSKTKAKYLELYSELEGLLKEIASQDSAFDEPELSESDLLLNVPDI